MAAGFAAAYAQGVALRQGGGAVAAARRTPPPVVARYEFGDGRAFVLDRTVVSRPMLRIEGSPEVWVLQPFSAPRGDIIYRNDQGRQVLRATKVGGLTIFTEERPGGAPAALAGPVEPLRPVVPVPAAVLWQRLAQSSLRASRAAQHLIEMEADYNPNSVGMTADAGMVAAEAMVRLAGRPGGRAILARVGRIVIVEGARPNAALRAGVLTITINPGMGFSGRPSSDRIIAAFAR